MGVMIGILGFLGIIVCIVLSVTFAIKRSRKARKSLVGLLVSFTMFAIGVVMTPPDTSVKQNDRASSKTETVQKSEDKTSSDQSGSNTNKGSSENNSTSNSYTAGEAKTSNGVLKVHFIDVGQADSILIQDGTINMLIDAGNNADSDTVTNYIRKAGITKLDYVVGTHPHEDHVGGLDAVIKAFDIGKVYMPKVSNTTQTYKDVLSAIQGKGLKVSTPTPGASFKLNTASAVIIAPNSGTYEDLNNNSIVIRLVFESTSFLFAGDAEDVSESEIISKGFVITSDVLKVGHHGSNSSTTADFLSKVSPKHAVIMVGKDNTYGHPQQGAMDRLKAKGIKVYRTDENGTIVATSDGKTISFNVKPGSYSYRSSGTASAGSTTAAKTTTAAPKTSTTATKPPTTTSGGSSIPSTTTGGKQYVDANGSGLIKGNISSTGEKIYHIPGGTYYNRTDAEAWFKTEAEAQAAGFRASKR